MFEESRQVAAVLPFAARSCSGGVTAAARGGSIGPVQAHGLQANNRRGFRRHRFGPIPQRTGCEVRSTGSHSPYLFRRGKMTIRADSGIAGLSGLSTTVILHPCA